MLNLLNAISIFGKEIATDMSTSTVMFILMIVQAVLFVIELVVFVILIVRTRRRKTEEVEPVEAPVIIYTNVPVTEPAVAEAEPEPQPIEPVKVPVVVETKPIVAPILEEVEGGTLRYDKSFMARIIQAENEIKNWYTQLKNEMLSYKGVKSRISWKRENFRLGRDATIKLSFRGETLCIYLPIDPNSIADSKYKIEDVSDNASYADTPCLYRIKNDKRARYALELIEFVMQTAGTEKDPNYVSQDFYMPYEGIVQLIDKGLVKRNIKTKENEAIFTQKKEETVTKEVAAADGNEATE